MHKSDLSIFLELSDIPTTSFHENRVSNYIKNKLNEFEIDFIEDKWGSIYKRQKRRRSRLYFSYGPSRI
jgi:putative aminopeptidase FrvX